LGHAPAIAKGFFQLQRFIKTFAVGAQIASKKMDVPKVVVCMIGEMPENDPLGKPVAHYSSEALAQEARMYIANHFTEPISLPHIADYEQRAGEARSQLSGHALHGDLIRHAGRPQVISLVNGLEYAMRITGSGTITGAGWSS